MARKLFTLPKSFRSNIDRALHDLYQEKSTTLHPMTLVPIYYRRMMRGDQFTFGVLESILRSEPTFAPLLSNWRLRFEWYFDSDANRYGWIDNNTKLSSEEVMNRKHHTAFITHNNLDVEDSLNDQMDSIVNRGSLHDYAGVAPGTGILVENNTAEPELFDGKINIDFHLTYLNIIRNYHVNRQFPDIPHIAVGLGSGSDENNYYTYNLQNMDRLFMFLRSAENGVHFTPTPADIEADENLKSYYLDDLEIFCDWLNTCNERNGGLFCSQFEPDLYQNLLSKDTGLISSFVTTQTLDSSSGSLGFTIEQFRLRNHLQGLYDKIFVSGGTDRELSRTIWGIESNRDYDIPELLCVHTEIIGTNLVTSTTAGSANDGSYQNVPGSMAGNINSRRGASRMQKFTAKTSGSLMCIVSLVPLVSYNENIERHLLEHNFMDEFTPDMARKGFENVPLSDYCSLPLFGEPGHDVSGEVIHYFRNFEYQKNLSSSVGRQVAWLREMSAVNRCHGEFSNGGENYDWILHRTFKKKDYPEGPESYFISPYGRPNEFQYPFVAQDLGSPNFNLQVAIKCDAYRPVPRKFMPNLGY